MAKAFVSPLVLLRCKRYRALDGPIERVGCTHRILSSQICWRWLKDDSVSRRGRAFDQCRRNEYPRLKSANEATDKGHGPRRPPVEGGKDTGAARRDLIRKKRDGTAGFQASYECA